MNINFTVLGEPVGKGRPRFTKNGHTYTPQKTHDYESKVRKSWKEQSGEMIPEFTPMTVNIQAYFPIPKSVSKKKRVSMIDTPHTKKPDADNIAKAILDALNGYSYTDDSAISNLVVVKRYGEIPRVDVNIMDMKVVGDK